MDQPMSAPDYVRPDQVVDFDIYGDARLSGDLHLGFHTLHERKNPDPEKFDLDRQGREHLTFSTGPHICIGNVLARAEMRAFTEAWVKRVPRFRIAKGATPEWRAGLVMALMHLPLEWPAPLSSGVRAAT